MCIVHKKLTANLKAIDNLIVSPDTSTGYVDLCRLTWLQHQEASGLKRRLIVCVLSVTEWLVSECGHTNCIIYTYKFTTATEVPPPLCIFVSLKPWHHFAESCLRNAGGNRKFLLLAVCVLPELQPYWWFTHLLRFRMKHLLPKILRSFLNTEGNLPLTEKHGT